jgi:hypothetical protein
MEDKRSIKKVLESQGDVHEKVANQSNGSSMTLDPLYSIASIILRGFCLD